MPAPDDTEEARNLGRVAGVLQRAKAAAERHGTVFYLPPGASAVALSPHHLQPHVPSIVLPGNPRVSYRFGGDWGTPNPDEFRKRFFRLAPLEFLDTPAEVPAHVQVSTPDYLG